MSASCAQRGPISSLTLNSKLPGSPLSSPELPPGIPKAPAMFNPAWLLNGNCLSRVTKSLEALKLTATPQHPFHSTSFGNESNRKNSSLQEVLGASTARCLFKAISLLLSWQNPNSVQTQEGDSFISVSSQTATWVLSDQWDIGGDQLGSSGDNPSPPPTPTNKRETGGQDCCFLLSPGGSVSCL